MGHLRTDSQQIELAAASFGYDGDGQRVVGTEGGTTTVYIGNYFEWHGTPAEAVKYYYSGATRVAMRVGANAPVYLMGDHLGSTSVAVNEQGAPVGGSPQLYKAWGETRAGSVPTKYQYTGQFNQIELGIYYYNARWYDPYLNRWIQPDSIIPDPVNSLDWDRYSYARNNPIKYTDPYGHSVDCGLGDPYCNAGKLDVTKRANDLLNGFMDKGDNRTWFGLTYMEQSILNEGGILEGVFDDARNGANAKDMAYVWYDPINLNLIIFTAVRTGIIVGPVVSTFLGGTRVFFHGGEAWHIGLETTNNMNIVHFGNHPTYGFHIAFGAVAPFVADLHIYLESIFPFIRIWRP